MENPIQGLMDTAMKNIKTMVDVDTVIGDPVTAPDGTIIIPISTVSFGFGAGGSEFPQKINKEIINNENIFGGGCGGGACVKPSGFLVVTNGNVRFLPLGPSSSPLDKIIDLMPDMIDKLNKMFTKKKDDIQSNPCSNNKSTIETYPKTE